MNIISGGKRSQKDISAQLSVCRDQINRYE